MAKKRIQQHNNPHYYVIVVLILGSLLSLLFIDFVQKMAPQNVTIDNFGENSRYLEYELKRKTSKVILVEEQKPSMFFSVPKKVLSVEGENIEVYEYSNEPASNIDFSKISRDATTISGVQVEWVNTPHIFKKGRIIVLYVGNNPKIISMLESILGPQAAGK